MNANELADKLNLFWHTENDKLFEEAEDMLRQQQAEIEALKSELDRAVELYTDKAIENEALKKELETCKTIVALSNIAWERKHGKD